MRCLGLSALVALLLLFSTEYLYYFPLTPLSLDTAGAARLPPAPEAVRLLFVGDILLGDAAQSTLEAKGYDHPFAATAPLIRAADLAVGNLEGPITSARTASAGRWSYDAPPDAAHALARAGFDLMDLANNHVNDRGELGLQQTSPLLAQAGLRSFGAGRSLAEARAPIVVHARGLSVGFLGYLETETVYEGRPLPLEHLSARADRAGVALAHTRSVEEDVRAIRPRVDLIFVLLHHGDRYEERPTMRVQKLCRRAIDAGADAVIGHGSHILGPAERYRGRPILYSVGNFAFGSGNILARFSLMAFLEADPRTRRLRRLELLPLYTVNRNPWVRFRSRVLVGRQARRVLRSLRDASWPHDWLRLAGGGRPDDPCRLVAELDRGKLEAPR